MLMQLEGKWRKKKLKWTENRNNNNNKKTQHNLYIQKKKSQKIHKDYWYNGKWR